MHSSTPSSLATLVALEAWSTLAHDAIESSLPATTCPRVRTLQHHLLRHHAKQRRQLRSWLGRVGSERKSMRPRAEAWSEVMSAMSAHDENVAFSAYALLERAVLVAFTRADRPPSVDPRIRDLVEQQKLEFLDCHTQFLRTRPAVHETMPSTTDTDREFRPAVAVAS